MTHKLSPVQIKALKMLSYGVPLNLRLYFTRPTVDSLLNPGYITETPGVPRLHHITDAGLRVVEVSK